MLLPTFSSWNCKSRCLSVALSAVYTIVGYSIWCHCELGICVFCGGIIHLYDHVKVRPVDSWSVLDEELELSRVFIFQIHLPFYLFKDLSLLHRACCGIERDFTNMIIMYVILLSFLHITLRIFVVGSDVLSQVAIHALSADVLPYNLAVLGYSDALPIWMNNPEDQICVHLREHKWSVIL